MKLLLDGERILTVIQGTYQETNEAFIFEQVTIPKNPESTYTIFELSGALPEDFGVATYVVRDNILVYSEVFKQEHFDEYIAKARSKRNDALNESDWTQLPDVLDDVLKAECAVYRQSLRDISSQPGYPFDIQWPRRPTPLRHPANR